MAVTRHDRWNITAARWDELNKARAITCPLCQKGRFTIPGIQQHRCETLPHTKIGSRSYHERLPDEVVQEAIDNPRFSYDEDVTPYDAPLPGDFLPGEDDIEALATELLRIVSVLRLQKNVAAAFDRPALQVPLLFAALADTCGRHGMNWNPAYVWDFTRINAPNEIHWELKIGRNGDVPF